MYISSIIVPFLVLVLIAALILVLNPQRDAVLNESCTITQCSTALKLKCIGGTCQCYSTESYTDKCTTLSTYMEPCFVLQNCFQTLGLTCQSQRCNCLSTYYWSGFNCTHRYTYSQSCVGDQCLPNIGLVCDSTSSTCLCTSTNL